MTQDLAGPVGWSVVILGVVVLLRRQVRLGARAAADRELAAGLGFTIDLISVVLGSGGTIRQAVATVADRGPTVVRPAFATALARAADGELLVDALARSVDELGPAFQPLVSALVSTERDGAPVSGLLERLADDAHQARRWQLEALRKRLPVTLALPLVCCFLPAVVVGAVVPLAVLAFRQLGL